MKQDELIKRATCCLCRKKLGETKFPLLFYVVEMTRYALDVNAIRRQSGLEMMLGGHAGLARAMGPDEDMATEFSNATVTVCDQCAMKETMVAQLAELGREEEKAKGD